MSEWRPMAELPEDLKQGDGEEFLMYWCGTVYIGDYDVDSASKGYSPWRSRSGDTIHPTLWCRIPALPDGKKL